MITSSDNYLVAPRVGRALAASAKSRRSSLSIPFATRPPIFGRTRLVDTRGPVRRS